MQKHQPHNDSLGHSFGQISDRGIQQLGILLTHQSSRASVDRSHPSVIGSTQQTDSSSNRPIKRRQSHHPKIKINRCAWKTQKKKSPPKKLLHPARSSRNRESTPFTKPAKNQRNERALSLTLRQRRDSMRFPSQDPSRLRRPKI